MIEVSSLTKCYRDDVPAVKDISFQIAQGEIVGLLGPNGAGKSTTMNIITGYLSATSGQVLVDGCDVRNDPDRVHGCIGYLPEQAPLYPEMTVREYLDFVCRLKGVSKGRKEHIRKLAEMTGISHVVERVIGNLSKGYKQRVGLAQALAGDPKVLVLDEPAAGLDPNQIIEMRNMIRQLGQNHTVILSSHILSEVQAVCERVIIIHEGVIVADGNTRELSTQVFKQSNLSLNVLGEEAAIRGAISRVPHIRRCSLSPAGEPGCFRCVLAPEPGEEIRLEVFRQIAGAGCIILEMYMDHMSLEELFHKLTNKDEDEESAYERL